MICLKLIVSRVIKLLSMIKLLKKLEIDYLLVNSTNEYLVEYSELSENARYTLTGFSGSTGDALVTKDRIYLFVDGRYHLQAEQEAKKGIKIVKLQLGQGQDNEIRKIIDKDKTLGIVAKKVSQKRLEGFAGYKIKLLEKDPINDFTESHSDKYSSTKNKPRKFSIDIPTLITNLEEVSYLSGYRDFSKNYSSKIWAKLLAKDNDYILFTDNLACEKYLKNFRGDLVVDKNSINAYDYSLIKNPIHKSSSVRMLKAIKTQAEIKSYQKAFEATDKAMMKIREFIEENKNLSEYAIAARLKEEFALCGAKNLSFKSIVAINKNSALAHYSQNSKNIKIKDGDLVLIDCGAYFEDGLATDITRVFVKGEPNDLQKKVYTLVLKAFLNAFNSKLKTGFELDKVAHRVLDNKIEGFSFSHGLGHGIGINVHEAPPALNKSSIAQKSIKNGMCFTIEPGLYNPEFFGIRLENSCYKKDGKIYSFAKMGYEGKLIDYDLLSKQEKKWLEEFEIL